MASSSDKTPTPVPFPLLENIDTASSTNRPPSDSNPAPSTPSTPNKRSRTSTTASIVSTGNRIRAASIKILEADPPPGMWAATAAHASKAPTLPEIRSGSFSNAGWCDDGQRVAYTERRERRASEAEEGGNKRWRLRRTSSALSTAGTNDATPGLTKGKRKSSIGSPEVGTEPFPPVTEEEMHAIPEEPSHNHPTWKTPDYDVANDGIAEEKEIEPSNPSSVDSETHVHKHPHMHHKPQRKFSNGYVPPPKLPWTTSTVIGLKSFWKWFLTPAGFLITVYGANVIAWGGMLFLLLCNASPAMCHPTCDDIQSPRRIWIEIDSQVVNGLFCVTGFGLAPWRFRDLYWWAVWRLGGSKRTMTGIRRLAGIHRGWFRLPGSDCLDQTQAPSAADPTNPAVPIPPSKIPDPPPTGVRATPTSSWKMDFVVHMNAMNTFMQVVLCFFMWHFNRYQRPSWATGTFVAFGCIVAGLGGIMMFHEGNLIKKVEGVPAGIAKSVEDVEAQVLGPEKNEANAVERETSRYSKV
ncbi:hypothetical protein BU16DRAFT_576584 [Lophium mytilinum]|uniref:Uncharacterized protein n=1 Tax=Lophium mytilinum TaxID=390894 RepID=A0A6A6RE00_9PEZI|nr:hypothetical protein BU16DRAFT_576584 [Lophium mytilinum]